MIDKLVHESYGWISSSSKSLIKRSKGLSIMAHSMHMIQRLLRLKRKNKCVLQEKNWLIRKRKRLVSIKCLSKQTIIKRCYTEATVK